MAAEKRTKSVARYTQLSYHWHWGRSYKAPALAPTTKAGPPEGVWALLFYGVGGGVLCKKREAASWASALIAQSKMTQTNRRRHYIKRPLALQRGSESEGAARRADPVEDPGRRDGGHGPTGDIIFRAQAAPQPALYARGPWVEVGVEVEGPWATQMPPPAPPPRETSKRKGREAAGWSFRALTTTRITPRRYT